MKKNGGKLLLGTAINKISILIFVLLLFGGAARAAATFVVNSTGDTSDAIIGDGSCNDGAGNCTLRAAIEEANSTAATDTINFSIAPFDGSVKTIAPNSALPSIMQTVFIDGYSQTGASANTALTTDNAVILIELNGINAGAGANGLTLSANDSTVRGLAINRFGRVGISLSGGDNNVIAGNFIGTDASGLIDLGNGSVGIYGEFASQSNGNLIGGTTLAARNIISGNGNAGILFEFQAINNIVQSNFVGLAADGSTVLANNGSGIGFGSFTPGTIIGGDDDDDGAADGIVTARNYVSGNIGSGIFLGNPATVSGNFIGTDATGTLARPNNVGISANVGSNSLIGGTTAGAGNLISGNTGDGIGLGNTGNTIVRRNRIGTAADGVSALANTGDGIEIASGGSNNQIGGTSANDGNIIAFNGEDGVQISDSGVAPVNNPVLGNAIYSNGGLGINLSLDSVTTNDAGDADGGANNRQNFPVILTAQTVGTYVYGTLNSTANATFRLEFFNSPTANASGNGEGQFFVGAINVTTDAGGDATFEQTFAPTSVIGSFISATATNLTTGDTSEFSNAQQVTGATAAPISIGGRVSDSFGRGIAGARVRIADSTGNVRETLTNSFGYYGFDDLSAGETYFLRIIHKNHQFSAQIISANEDREDIDFIADGNFK